MLPMFRKIVIVAVLIGVPMGMLYPLWRCPTTAGEDDFVFYWPVRKIVAEQMRSGRVPVWNPHMGCGVPLLADPQSAVLYPPHWMFLFLPAATAYSLCVFGLFTCAGGGTYLYLRRVGLSSAAAVFGAMAFTFSGFFVGHRAHLSMLQAAAMLPWGLWSIEKVRSGAGAGFAWMAPIFALTLAAGHLPTVIHLVVVWLAYLFFRGRPIGRALTVAAAAAGAGLLVMAPQVLATVSYLNQSIRTGVPYVVAGENSFFPLCAVLALFPFILSHRTGSFFPHGYWGPWHLCEMLGYVGLLTLVLAAGAVRVLFRKQKPSRTPERLRIKPTDSHPWDSTARGCAPPELTRLVRLWVWIVIGAGIWALGYYLPTYWLIYRIPVVGMVRCPARMLLTIGFGLSALSAMAVHALSEGAMPRLRRAIMRWALIYLPACMAGALAVLWVLPRGEAMGLWDVSLALSGSAGDMRDALHPLSSAVYLPVAMAAMTAGTLGLFGRAPKRRGWMLIVLLLADLFLVVRFVDAPTRRLPPLVPEQSPAAEWLRAHAPENEPYRVLGFSESYHDRTAEFLLPMTGGGLGFESVSYYGPLQPADHARMLGFRPWGQNEHWRWLIRSNHLLSLFNVRYILGADGGIRPMPVAARGAAAGAAGGGGGAAAAGGAAGVSAGLPRHTDDAFHRLMRSVRIPQSPPPPDGPNLLTDAWSLRHGWRAGGGLVLRAPHIWQVASAVQEVKLTPGEVYRMAFDVRAASGAGNLVAGRFVPDAEDPYPPWDDVLMMRIDVEQITRRWRHFEKTFRVPADAAARQLFEVLSCSIRRMEVRNITLRRSSWPTPINFAGRLAGGEPVYVDRTPGGLPPVREGYPRVHIYENRLCLPRRFPVEQVVFLDDNEQVIEALRWRAREYDLTRQVLLPRTRRPLGRLEFVSERRHLLDGRTYVSANGLGAVCAPGAAPGRSGLPRWPVLLSVGGLGLYLGLRVLWRQKANRGRARDV